MSPISKRFRYTIFLFLFFTTFVVFSCSNEVAMQGINRGLESDYINFIISDNKTNIFHFISPRKSNKYAIKAFFNGKTISYSDWLRGNAESIVAKLENISVTVISAKTMKTVLNLTNVVSKSHIIRDDNIFGIWIASKITFDARTEYIIEISVPNIDKGDSVEICIGTQPPILL